MDASPASDAAHRIEPHLPGAALDTLRELERQSGLEPGEWVSFRPFRTTFAWIAWNRLSRDIAHDPEDPMTLTEARREAAQHLDLNHGTLLDRVSRFNREDR